MLSVEDDVRLKGIVRQLEGRYLGRLGARMSFYDETVLIGVTEEELLLFHAVLLWMQGALERGELKEMPGSVLDRLLSLSLVS